jgi:hypothetical protein
MTDKAKREILNKYLKKHNLPKEISDKIDIHSVHTDKFAYKAMRIGNNIGDPYVIAVDIVFLETLADKYDLIFDLTDYPELHTRGISEKDLDIIVEAAKIFENRRGSLSKEYDKIVQDIKKDIKDKFKKMI